MSNVSSMGPVMFSNGTLGAQASIVMATLQAVAEQQAIAQRPLKVPDIRVFGVANVIDIKA